MAIEELNLNAIQGRIRLLTYQTFYGNVRNRLAPVEEILPFDFLNSQHDNNEQFLKYYQDTPKLYRCLLNTGIDQPAGLGPSYLVSASSDKVVLLLEPEDAIAHNFPFLAILEGNFFQPYWGCPTTYWQTHVEPAPPQVENVLSSALYGNGWLGSAPMSRMLN